MEMFIQRNSVPLLDLHEPYGGCAYTSSHLQHQLTEQYISEVSVGLSDGIQGQCD